MWSDLVEGMKEARAAFPRGGASQLQIKEYMGQGQGSQGVHQGTLAGRGGGGGVRRGPQELSAGSLMMGPRSPKSGMLKEGEETSAALGRFQ